MILSDTIKNGLLQIFYYLILGLIVFVVTKLYKFHNPKDFKIKIRSSALWSLGAAQLSFAFIGLIFSIFPNNGPKETGKIVLYSFNNVFQLIILSIIVYSPVYFAIRRNKESVQSIGLSKLNLYPSIILGLFLVLIIGGIQIFYKPTFTFKVNSSRLWGLIYFAIVGFSEEIVIRGYLQSRLILWLGKWKGWTISSVIMVLWHFWQRIFIMNLTPIGALINILLLLLPSFFLGFLMIRTNNIVAPGIVHTFMDWFTLFV